MNIKYVTYDENGNLTGYQITGGIPSGDYLEVDIPEEDYNIYSCVESGGLAAKIKEEIDAAAAAALSLSERTARAEITAYRAEILAKGMPYGDGQYIQADTLSRLNLKDIIENIDLMPFPYTWKTWDNTDLILNSSTDMQAMATTLSGWINTTFTQSFDAEAALSSAETAEAMAAIVEQYKENNPL
jgi:hypothetical protein